MENSSITSIGVNTRKVLDRIPGHGLYSGNKRLTEQDVVERIALFHSQKEGVGVIPSGANDKVFVRNAVILDVIVDTEKLKMQATLKYLAETAKSNIGTMVTLHYDPLTGEVTNYQLKRKDQLLAAIGVDTPVAGDVRWAQEVNARNMEVMFANDGQISEVTFETEDNRQAEKVLESGLTKEQIMVMTGIAQHNKSTWNGKAAIQRPLPEVKRNMVRLGRLSGGDNFWNAFAYRLPS